MKKSYRILQSLMILLVIVFCNACSSRNTNDDGRSDGDYNEKYRPQYHFSPKSGWMNDPNGLVYLDNEYHLFYQHFPDSTVWGPMHWGHAVSTDLINWKHLPVALFPDSYGYIFSGSAVADNNNTSGLGDGIVPALVAIFTYHNPVAEKEGSNSFQNQGLAFSNDRGRTWHKYKEGPVLLNPGFRDFRDPKIFWHEDTGKWIMILAVRDRVHLYSSSDLLKWSFESEFGVDAGSHDGVWECPDLFPLEVKNNESTKWVMLVSINPGGPNGGSATQYFTGEFDGHEFITDKAPVRWMDHGTDNYAGVTFSGILPSDGRRILIGWMSNWNYANVVPASSWRSAMTIPRELSLYYENGDYLLSSLPVKETLLLRKDTLDLTRQVQTGHLITNEQELDRTELSLELETAGYDTVGIILESNKSDRLVIGYSGIKKEIFIDRSGAGDTTFSKRYTKIVRAPYNADSTLNLHLFIDTTSAELFADGGKMVMTTIFFPRSGFTKLSVIPAGSGTIVRKAEIYHLKSIWN
jgi:fructan beta-fructosidase